MRSAFVSLLLAIAVARPALAAEARAPQALGEDYRLVGVISCDPCRDPFDPVAVVAYEPTGKLLHLRPGDTLRLAGGGALRVVQIDVGKVVLEAADGRRYVLEAEGAPSDSGADTLVTHGRPDAPLEPPPGSVPYMP